jgi:excisionase family DNA binding protein
VDLSVAEAASRLNVDPSRVGQLLRSGRIAGRRSGRMWLVDADALNVWNAQSRAPGRPMAPARAWGLLDMLDGGSAPWLSSVARSQVKARLRDLRDAKADDWRALLRARSDVVQVRLHPAGLRRLLADRRHALPAGPAGAAELGADLVAIDPVAEAYVRPQEWPALVERWHADVVNVDGNLRVHLPREVWPFAGNEVGLAALAADLLECSEPRAASAGLKVLRQRIRDYQ